MNSSEFAKYKSWLLSKDDQDKTPAQSNSCPTCGFGGEGHRIDCPETLKMVETVILGVGEKSKVSNPFISAINTKVTNNPIQPNYYKATIKGVEIDVYDIAAAFNLSFMGGNALKYLLRAGHKQNESRGKDLSKAIESLRREAEIVNEIEAGTGS